MRTIEITLCTDDMIHAVSVLLRFGRVYRRGNILRIETECCVKVIHNALLSAKLVYPFYLYSKVD